MQRDKEIKLIWGVGLSPDEALRLRKSLPPGVKLVNRSAAGFLTEADPAKENPLLVIIAHRAFKNLSAKARRAFRDMAPVQKALLLDESGEPEALADLAAHAFSAVLPNRPGKKVLTELVHRSSDVRELFADLFRMTREISLERELLARKNAQLAFVNRFLSNIAASLDVGEILRRAKEELNLLLPAAGLSAVFWRREGAGVKAEVLLDRGVDPLGLNFDPVRVEFLLEAAAREAEAVVEAFDIRRLSETCAAPHPPLLPGRSVVLPLAVNGQSFGCVALESDEPYNLGRDQVELLHSVQNHLALALSNALRFTDARIQAEFDGLTRVYNRAAFDRRIGEECARAGRYGAPLALLMVDFDHFKRVNDDYGHQAGDQVLRDLGRIIMDEARTSDFTARYGGEEFALLLPETGLDQALVLAERLRERIAMHVFSTPFGDIRGAVSIGAADDSGRRIRPEALLRDADKALYEAKRSGRNRVVAASRVQAESSLEAAAI